MNEILPTIFSICMHMLRFILRPIYALIYFNKPRNITRIKNPLLKMSAVTLAKKIRNGELSSQTIMEAYIKRVKEVNPMINAVVQDRFEEALKEAKSCDEKLKNGEVVASTLEWEKPLYGIPVTIKESTSLKGMSLTGCSLMRKDFVAENDGEAVEMLKNAGAIPMLVSNTPELCTAINSFNYVYGQTVNPYDRRKTSGGSSGGEGALIAAGASLIGLGSDIVGSIRLPSFFNGIFGHKPTSGLVSIERHYPIISDETFRKFLVVGPMARYVEDLELAMKVLTSKCERPLPFGEPVNMKNLRVFYVDNFNSVLGLKSTTSDIKEVIEKAVYFCSKNGAHVEHISQEWVADVYNMELATFGELDIPEMLIDPQNPEKKRRPHLEFVKSVVGLSKYTPMLTLIRLIVEHHGGIPRSKIETYKNKREELRKKINETLKDDGVFIHPTFPHAADYPELMFFDIDNTCYCAFANLMQLPATQVPMGLNDRGMPIGFQVLAASHQDHLCLAVAKEFEKAFGGWVPFR